MSVQRLILRVERDGGRGRGRGGESPVSPRNLACSFRAAEVTTPRDFISSSRFVLMSKISPDNGTVTTGLPSLSNTTFLSPSCSLVFLASSSFFLLR